MTDADPVVVRQFMSTIEAEIAQTALEAAGIESIVSVDDGGGMHPHMQVGRTTLLVRPADVADAIRVLDTPAEEAP